MNTKRGFTLIELLTVIAIIGILASILIPVVGRVRESARASVCVSNLRQWHSALMLYANDHNDQMPAIRYPTGEYPGHKHFWSGYLAFYMGLEPPIWDRQSPLIHDTVAECPSVAWRDGYTYISYGANGDSSGDRAFFLWKEDGTRTLHHVEPRTIVFGDQGPVYERRWLQLNRNRAGNGALAYRHGERANVVMMGGNVVSFHLDDNVEEEDDLWRADR